MPASTLNRIPFFQSTPSHLCQLVLDYKGDYDKYKILAELSLTHSHFKKLALQVLLQSVLDDRRKEVEEMLAINSGLLLLDPIELHLPPTQSQYTWQTFEVDHPLVIALVRNQVEMVKRILPPFLEATCSDVKLIQILWERADGIKAKQSEKTKQFNVEKLIQAIVAGNARKTVESKAGGDVSTNDPLETFRHLILPSEPVALTDYFAIEKLLIKAYLAYENNFYELNCDQRQEFSIQVVGYLQSLLAPEDAKIFCQGLEDVVRGKKPIEVGASVLRLRREPGVSFYRSSLLDQTGLGRSYLIGGMSGNTSAMRTSCVTGGRHPPVMQKLCRAKAAALENLKSQHALRDGSDASLISCVVL